MASPEGHDPLDRLQVRASNADRQEVVESLKRHTSEGRLTLEEFDDRLGEVYAARTLGELRAVTRNLPVVAPAPPRPRRDEGRPVPAPASHSARHGAKRNHPLAYWLWLSAFMIFIWLASGAGYFWPIWVIGPTGFMLALKNLERGGGGGGGTPEVGPGS